MGNVDDGNNVYYRNIFSVRQVILCPSFSSHSATPRTVVLILKGDDFMGWTIGAWRILGEGQVHQSLKKCLNIVLASSADVTIDNAAMLERQVRGGREVYEALRQHEKIYGTRELLKVLSEGLKITCTKQGSGTITFTVLLRTPSVSAEQAGLYKDMIGEWVEADPMPFTDRFFRLPKITEDVADRYLDNPLEKSLKQTFGFDFQYKILIHGENDYPDVEPLRKKLYQTLE